jgi:TRAP-type uncharacterized transport system fused permease subunit
VLAASVLAPALTALNLPFLISHMFVFYFAALGNITPPVCAAVFLGANSGRQLAENRLAVLPARDSDVHIPFTFAYNASLMLSGSIGSIAFGLGTAAIAYSSSERLWPAISTRISQCPCAWLCSWAAC